MGLLVSMLLFHFGLQNCVKLVTFISGDSMAEHNGLPFSTLDRDNDNSIKDNCAIVRGGPWWYDNCGIVRFSKLKWIHLIQLICSHILVRPKLRLPEQSQSSPFQRYRLVYLEIICRVLFKESRNENKLTTIHLKFSEIISKFIQMSQILL